MGVLLLSPITILLLVRTSTKENPRFKQLMAALYSPEVQAKAKELFGDGAILVKDSAPDLQPLKSK